MKNKAKTGIVLKLNKKTAYLMTQTGEFIEVQIGKDIPAVGQEYTGLICNKTRTVIYKKAAAACIASMLLISSVAYAYFNPESTITVQTNPSIQLTTNKFNRVIDVSSSDKNIEKEINKTGIKNKTVDSALSSILDQADKYNISIGKDEIEVAVSGSNSEKFKKSIANSQSKYKLRVKNVKHSITKPQNKGKDNDNETIDSQKPSKKKVKKRKGKDHKKNIAHAILKKTKTSRKAIKNKLSEEITNKKQKGNISESNLHNDHSKGNGQDKHKNNKN